MRTRVHRYVRACVRVPVYRCACLVCTRVSVCASVNAVYACRVSASVCRDMRLVWTGTRVHVRECIVHTCMCVNAPCIAPCVCVCACLRACTRAFACASRVRTGALCVCVRVCAQAYVGLVAVGGLPRPVSLCGGALLWPRGRSHHRTPSRLAHLHGRPLVMVPRDERPWRTSHSAPERCRNFLGNA